MSILPFEFNMLREKFREEPNTEHTKLKSPEMFLVEKISISKVNRPINSYNSK